MRYIATIYRHLRRKNGLYQISRVLVTVLPGLLVTTKRQGKHPLSFSSTLFAEDTAVAQAALYLN
jgi:hypothetical protein